MSQSTVGAQFSASNSDDKNKRGKLISPALPDDAPRVKLQASLNRDLAGFMTMLLVIIVYHIQHPTLLFRAQFGRSFRDEGLQEGVAIALLIAATFLVGSGFWGGRKTVTGRLKVALTVGLAVFALHGLVMIYGKTDIFTAYYDLSAEFMEETFREADLLPPMKAGNSSAVLAGAALASAFCLWSPWERWRAYQKFNSHELLQEVAGVITLILIFVTHHLQNPWLLARTSLGQDIGNNPSYPFVAAMFLFTSMLLLFTPHLRQPSPVKSAMMVLLSLYTFHILNVVLAGDNIFMTYYQVTPETYELLPNNTTVNHALLSLDRGALFGGVALVCALYLWSPWERLHLYNESVQKNIIPLGIGLLTLVLWEALIEIFQVKQFLLPRPSVIWLTLLEDYPKLIAAGWFTFLNALKGFMLGCGLGILTGIGSARFTKFSTAILPLAIAANSVPIIAFAPIMNIWFGVTSPNSKIAIVAVMSYFPAMISTVRGLTSVNKIQLELMRSYAATELDIFRKLRLPTALPFMFSALKLATTLSMIGAIVSEFFGGSLAGLGYRIREDAALFRFPESWSAIIVASLFGIAFYLLISALERAAMPWYQSFREKS